MTAEVIDLDDERKRRDEESEIGSIMRKAAGTRSYVTVLDLVRALYRGRLAYNEMAEAEELDGQRLRDAHLGVMSEHIERRSGLAPSDAQLHKAIAQVADENRYHPVQRFLRGVRAWDGSSRWRTIPRELFGHTEDDGISGIALERFAISCVARALSPGCQVDTVLILQGTQGHKKTTFFRVLAGEWHGEGAMDIHNNKAPLLLSASWIWVWDELTTAMRGREEVAVKEFVTRMKDVLIRPYGRHPIEKARSAVIGGTTNAREILTDVTGDRRYLIVPVLKRVDDSVLRPMREQLWAEALHLYRSKRQWHLTDDEEAKRSDAAAEWRAPEAWLEPVSTWLASEDARRIIARHGAVSANDIAAGLGVPVERRDKGIKTRIGIAMDQLQWVSRRQALGKVKVTVYEPPPPKEGTTTPDNPPTTHPR